MSVLHVLATQVSVAAGYEIGTGRTVPTAAALVGLISVGIGVWGRVRARRTGTGNGRTGIIVGLVAGLVSLIVGGVHGANAAGGLGTGNGLAGAIGAVAFGLIGVAMGWLALVRYRRSGRGAGSMPVS